ncbi:hypothetical protein LAZ67_6002010 [Cordylochernes scorpioides]|uniref:Peroxin-12 n=1 Tax=Cordylochernes scorpioides TaxID=51811 RepID=A0ABY6KJK3_9ARAC|nr:hypothetical protein LAZ67_6002010 [Cordylochernes scorpioides]
MDQRTCIKFCVKNEIKCADAFRMLTVAFGEATLDRSNVYRWYKMFSEGREDVNDEERKMILANRRITVREVAEDLKISIGSCHLIFINDLGMRRVAAKFVPKLLNCDQKQHRMNIANEMLDSVRDDPNLLQRVITGDEAWVYGHDVETARTKTEKSTPSSVESIRQKRPDLWKNKNWLLHHDNAPAHTSLLVRDFLAKNNTLMMPQPPYSPDLAPLHGVQAMIIMILPMRKFNIGKKYILRLPRATSFHVSAATGAKLTQSEMVRSLACLTLLPYLRQRLHDLFLEMENSSWTLRTFYPSFYCLLHLVDLACQVLYSLGLTSAHSPYLYLAGVRLRSGGQQSGMALGRLLAIIAFLLQFLRTWYARPEGAPSLLALRSPGPPSKLPGLPRVCPLCKKSPAQPTVLPVSGVVFCQECILDHLSSHPFCPVTRYPVSTATSLIRIVL